MKNLKTTKKQTVAKAKAVTGASKKPKSKLKLGFLALAGLLLFSTIGYTGFVKFKEHSLNAKAANWSTIGSFGNVWISACKTRIQSPYGDLYKLNLVGKKAFNGGGYIGVNVFRNGAYVQGSESHTWWGNVTAVTTYLSVIGGDTYQVYGKEDGFAHRGTLQNISPLFTRDC